MNGIALSAAERAEYAAQKRLVQAGKTACLTVGIALDRIREARLYREEYATFEAFVAAFCPWWGIRRAYQVMEEARGGKKTAHNASQTQPKAPSLPVVETVPDQAEQARRETEAVKRSNQSAAEKEQAERDGEDYRWLKRRRTRWAERGEAWALAAALLGEVMGELETLIPEEARTVPGKR